MSGFIEWLEDLNAKDTRVRAVLRRSLAFDPGTFPPAYPYVEPFVREDDSSWRRRMLDLVSGLWAAHWREGERGQAMSLGKACAALREVSASASVERRFITLLDADSDQLSHRLRQMIALLAEHSIDFGALLNGLVFWNDDEKRTQNSWAREFYRAMNVGVERAPAAQEEVAK